MAWMEHGLQISLKRYALSIWGALGIMDEASPSRTFFALRLLQVAAQRCKRTFSKADIESLAPTKNKGKSKQSKKEKSEASGSVKGRDEAETLTEEELHELMLFWASNGFQPTGPQGFMPTAEGKVLY